MDILINQFRIGNYVMRYDPVMIQPFRDELTRIGFSELRTPEEVDAAVDAKEGTNLVVINSVCGCAAGKARPGIALALRRSTVRPDKLTTVFAGGDIEATARLRERLGNIPPSSPSMAFYKNGELVHFIPRYQLESRTAEEIASHLMGVFNEYCSPSVTV
ncbi:MAG TPA: BrxA/BrxB family bacilliredoxin [Bacteroidota bacterium]|nr:BrxA/BrxB family bacilliredoxin [Bacteroidota bacterium]